MRKPRFNLRVLLVGMLGLAAYLAFVDFSWIYYYPVEEKVVPVAADRSSCTEFVPRKGRSAQ